MKKIFATTILLGSVCSATFAQNLNPEVQVTNDYEARMANVTKASLPMTIPDSLTRFSTSVDYSVFPTEYRGAYDFSPYAIEVAPEPREFQGRRLYLRAGAGYSFHPVLRVVYSPVQRGLFTLNGNAGLNGYGGKYHTMDDRGDYDGHDYSTGAGINVRWDDERFDVAGRVFYDGIYTSDYAVKSSYNNFGVKLDARSCEEDFPVPFKLDAAMHIASDAVTGLDKVGEVGYVVKGYFVPMTFGKANFLVDLHSQGSFYSARLFGPAMLNGIAPKLVWEPGIVRLSAGVNVSISDYLSLHPDARADLNLGCVGVYAAVSGGQSFVDYSGFKTANHWFNATYVNRFSARNEKINARLGVRGSLFKHLEYEVQGGYAMLDKVALDAITVPVEGRYDMGIGYVAFNQAFVRGLIGWKSEDLEVNADLLYRNATLLPEDYLSLPPFTGEISAVYNWHKRAFAGLRCRAQAERVCKTATVPGFVDLGLYGEFKFSRCISAWVQAGNILNQRIAPAPTHIAGGVNFTAGICLELK